MENRLFLANSVLVTAGLGLSGIGLYVFSRRDFFSPGMKTLVAVAALLGIAGVGLALAAPKPFRLNVAISVLATGLSLYFAEAVFTVIDRPRQDRAAVARRSGVPFDTRTPLAVVADLRAAGIEAYPLMAPNSFLATDGLAHAGGRIFPLSGVSRAVTVSCNESGTYVIAESDAHGFNNPPKPWADEVDVVLIGDSFAYGACVELGATIGGRLRERGRRVISLGMSGTGPLLQLAILREYAEMLRPRIVFWLYYEGNDLSDLREEARSPILRRYLVDEGFSQDLAARQTEIDVLLKAFFERESRKALADGRREAASRASKLGRSGLDLLSMRSLRARLSRLRTAGSWESHGADFREILRQARDQVAAAGGRLVFAYLPAYQRLAKPGSAAYFRREAVLETAAGLGLPVLDTTEILSRAEDPLAFFPLRIAGHYNEGGYAAITRKMESFLPVSDGEARSSDSSPPLRDSAGAGRSLF